MNLLRAITTVASYTMVSRVFGFLRDILIASILGAGGLADAFFIAFRFPNLFRRLFAEGAFAAAFVPIFSNILEQEGRENARIFAEQAFTILVFILVVLVAIVEFTMPWLMLVLAPGYGSQPDKMEIAVELSRIVFPYLLFISLVSLQSGVLNSVDRFAAAALAPVLFNLLLIAAMLGFHDRLATPAHVLSWAVSLAGLVQFLWLFWNCKRAGFLIRPNRPHLTKETQLLGQRILPVIFGSSIYQVNLLIGTILATMVADGAVSYLYYADRVTQLPLGVIGVAVGTALLPTLSRQLATGDPEAAFDSQNRALELGLLFVFPAAAALFVIAQPIITVLFQRGAFGVIQTEATAMALMAYSTGLPAYVLIRILAPGFFARQNTNTPVRIAAVAMGANVILNLIFMQFWGHVGLALAASLSAWINAMGLALALRARGQLPIDRRLSYRAPRILLATLGMACGLFVGERALAMSCGGPCGSPFFAIFLLMIGGLALYGTLAQLLGAAQWRDLRGLSR